MKIKDCIIVNTKEDYATAYKFIRKVDNSDWLRREYFPCEFPVILKKEELNIVHCFGTRNMLINTN